MTYCTDLWKLHAIRTSNTYEELQIASLDSLVGNFATRRKRATCQLHCVTQNGEIGLQGFTAPLVSAVMSNFRVQLLFVSDQSKHPFLKI